MLDSELIPFIGKFLESCIAQGFPNLGPSEVIQGAQPTQEGTPKVPTVIYIKLPDRPRGWPMRKYLPVPGSPGSATEVVMQLYETSIQVSCLKWQDPTMPNAQVVTASDLLNRLMMGFTMPSAIYEFNKLGVNLLRIDEVTNDPFENDNHQFEFHPTFVVVITHSREVDVKVGAITSADEFIHRV